MLHLLLLLASAAAVPALPTDGCGAPVVPAPPPPSSSTAPSDPGAPAPPISSTVPSNPGAPGAPGTGAPPTLPQITDGGANVPNPPAGSQLRHIALGFGIQNYTCAAIGGNATANGALAILYDATPLFPGQSPDSLSQADFDNLAARVLQSHPVPLNFNDSTAGRVGSSRGASLISPFTMDAPLQVEGMKPVPFAGRHLFNAAGVPEFILEGGAVDFLGTKLAGVPAPKTADKGPEGTGAVDWLQLGAKNDTVGDVKFVYRVTTAGGNSHGCAASAGLDTTSYAAMYWFFA